MAPAFNSSVRMDRTSSNVGALALREALDASAILPYLESTLINERAQGGKDLHDAIKLGPNRLWDMARCDARG